jgi:hypothetical protein|tara:strand:- start:272 stop:421 length:150 start_codon:yes stop_codon:yes gene_type:complete
MVLPNFNGLLALNFATTAQIDTREFRIASASIIQVTINISVVFGEIVML